MHEDVSIEVMQQVFKYLCSGESYEVNYFQDEYFLLIQTRTLAKVRVYLDGSIWETNGDGDYKKGVGNVRHREVAT